jgi:hypothetical protein
MDHCTWFGWYSMYSVESAMPRKPPDRVASSVSCHLRGHCFCGLARRFLTRSLVFDIHLIPAHHRLPLFGIVEPSRTALSPR